MVADNSWILQYLLDIGVNHSKMERYVLQPAKSVVLEISNKRRRITEESQNGWDMNRVKIATDVKTMHVGICRSVDTNVSALIENLKKAKQTLYSLMAADLHGENGIDPNHHSTYTRLTCSQFCCMA